jgi:hypothetical protein
VETESGLLKERHRLRSSAHRVVVLGSIGRSGSRRFFRRVKTALRSQGEYLACQREDRTRNVSFTHLNDAALVVGIKLDPLEAHTRNTTGYFRWIKSMGFNEGDSRDRADIKKLTRCGIRGKR